MNNGYDYIEQMLAEPKTVIRLRAQSDLVIASLREHLTPEEFYVIIMLAAHEWPEESLVSEIQNGHLSKWIHCLASLALHAIVMDEIARHYDDSGKRMT